MRPPSLRDELLDGCRDLVLGSSCLGCHRPGRLLCPRCRGTLPAAPVLSWPTPVPPGLAPPWAAGEYDGLLRRLVIEHKEESRYGLGAPLGRLLAASVAQALRVPGPRAGERGPASRPTDVLLVPVPSRPGVARRRGDDPTRRVVRVAAAALRREGRAGRGGRVLVADLLRSHDGVQDQAGLDAGARARNLAGSMWVPSRALRGRATPGRRALVVLCDDVLTTGATAREGQRALAAVGVEVAAIAVVGAVRRRLGPPSTGV